MIVPCGTRAICLRVVGVFIFISIPLSGVRVNAILQVIIQAKCFKKQSNNKQTKINI